MIPLSPLGTVRQRTGALGSTAHFPSELRAPAATLDLGEGAIYLAWGLAQEAALPPAETRALELLLLASLAGLRQGSTRLPLSGDEGTAHLDALWPALGGTADERTLARELCAEVLRARLAGQSARLDSIAGLAGDRKPLILDGPALYHLRLHVAESALAKALSARLQAPDVTSASPDAIAFAIDEVCARPQRVGDRPITLSEAQLRAIKIALSRPLAVVSGGPGTGKTSIVTSLLRVLQRLDVPAEAIALAAPTGKAAFRMRQSLARGLASIADPAPVDTALRLPEAQTLHRLLGYSPSGDRFAHHPGNPLDARVVIVDEVSMIDLHLMERLLAALRNDAHLVLLGDADQLPSIDAGVVLRDLLPRASASEDDSRARATVRLTESWRMSPADPSGRHVLAVAGAVQAGDCATLLDKVGPAAITRRSSATELAFAGVEQLAAAARSDFLDLWYRTRIAATAELVALGRGCFALSDERFGDEDQALLARLFAHAEHARLLCVTRGQGRAGAARINALLHERTVADARASGDAAHLGGSPAFYPGEPIMMLRNDYDRGLWNGDQGLVLRVAEPGQPISFMAVFPRDPAFVAFHLESLRAHLSHAWATTVHKSQGSEVDHVALLLPDEDLPLLTRELIYTALTRARRSATLIGDPDILRTGIERRVHRFSGLAARLR